MSEWRPIPGYCDRYEVSSDGQIRRRTFIDRNGRTNFTRTLRMNTGSGYYAAYIAIDGRKQAILLHRALALAFIPNPQNLGQVNHIDGDKLNNAFSNLEWVTARDNAVHARRTGLLKQKLTAEDVREIRRRFVPRGSGTSNSLALAAEFGVTPEQVRNVAHRRRFIWLE